MNIGDDMLKSTIIIISATLLSTALCADIEEGKEAFDESNCMDCHLKSHFKAREEKVNDYKKLHKTVSMCAYNSKTQWFDDELDDVVKYLNREFYHFKDTKK